MELEDEMALERPPKVQKEMLKELGGNSKSKTTLEFQKLGSSKRLSMNE